MLFVSSSQLTEGMCVAEDVRDHYGRVLIARGQRIRASHVAGLGKFGIHSLFIDPNNGETPAPPAKSNVRAQCEDAIAAVAPGAIQHGRQLSARERRAIRDAADSLVTSLVHSPKSVLALSHDADPAGRPVQHAVNTAALAVALGVDFRLPNETLRDIGAAMLLHDVGMALLPDVAVQSGHPPAAEEIDRLKAHSLIGYEYAKRADLLSPSAAELLLTHHEFLDGSGYPRGLTEESLTLSSRIVAVAEAFDSLTSDRLGITGILPDAALAWMLGAPNTLYDRTVVLALSRRVPLYRSGSAVLLSTGETGIVAGTPPGAPRRPVVLIHSDRNGLSLRHPLIVDLTRETGRAIARCAPTIEALRRHRETGAPISTIDPALAIIG